MPDVGKPRLIRTKKSGSGSGDAGASLGGAHGAHLSIGPYHRLMLELRPYREADRVSFVSLVTDADVMRPMDGPLAEDAAHARFDGFLRATDSGSLCARAADDDDTYLGHGFLVEREDPRGVELGFLVLPRHQGNGHGTAIAKALVRIGFEELELPRIIATVDEDNVASIRVLEKAGFEDLGVRLDESGPYRLFAIAAHPEDQSTRLTK